MWNCPANTWFAIVTVCSLVNRGKQPLPLGSLGGFFVVDNFTHEHSSACLTENCKQEQEQFTDQLRAMWKNGQQELNPVSVQCPVLCSEN